MHKVMYAVGTQDTTFYDETFNVLADLVVCYTYARSARRLANFLPPTIAVSRGS
jgi:hypothetical protein